ncbi:MAG: hypothetical protein Phyf2KO_08320 [Phycisphaerales bacterium]
MLKQDLVSRLTRRIGVGSNKAERLSRNAGKARAPMADSFEALEPRILLSGDHPGIDEVFDDVSPVAPTVITLDGNGRGDVLGEIGDVPGDTGDFFQFTAATTGFVSILADTGDESLTGPSALDSAVELYMTDGTKISGDTEGLDNGITGRGLAPDGWYGFVAQAGETYFIRVLGESGTTGDYSIEVNAGVTNLTVDSATGFARTGSGNSQQQRINNFQEDQLYSFTTPDLESFDSLGSVMAGDIFFGNDPDGFYFFNPMMPLATDGRVNPLDTRVELFDAQGNLISANDDSGYLDDGFIITRFERDSTYYVRVRSDAVVETNVFDGELGGTDDVSKGDFELRIQAKGTDFALNPVTRVGVVDRIPGALMNGSADYLRDNHSAQIFTFEALGSGQTIINFFAYNALGGRSWDPKISLYDAESLTAVATNDTAQSFDAFDRSEIVATLEGGRRYYVVVDAFDGLLAGVAATPRDLTAGDNLYRLVIESSATIDRSDLDQQIDDHIDIVFDDDDPEIITNTDTIRDLATPLVWGNPLVPTGYVDPATDGVDTNMDMIPDLYGFPTPFGPMPRYFDVFDFPNPVNDHSLVVQAFASGRLDTATDTDVFMFVPQVDHLGSFEGSLEVDMDDMELVPPIWNIDGRPASRISIAVDFELEWTQLGPVAIQIYDSNFNLVSEEFETPQGSVNTDTVGPAGVESPSLLGPDPETARKVELLTSLDLEYWGGEAYYLVISSAGTRSRYSLAVQGDAQDDTYGDNFDAPEEGNFAAAVNTTVLFDNFSGLASTTGNSNFVPEFRTVGVESGLDPMEDMGDYFDEIRFNGQLGRITNYNETDMYRFVAPRTGTAEVLISTTQITDGFLEQYIDNVNMLVADQNTLTKTYNSPLDAAFRVYDSNGVQIAYVNNYLGFDNEGTVIEFGNGFNPNVGNATFLRKDPRLVLDVIQGQEYFVVVESSQRYSANAEAGNIGDRVMSDPDAGDVDWRVATGSYKLIVNATPESNTDDHTDLPGVFQETVIAFDSDPESPTNGMGSVSGIIEAESDFDWFSFVAPKDGLLTLRIDPSAALSVAITIFDGNGDPVFIPNNTAIGGEPLTTSFLVSQADRYSISVFGLAGSGTYEIDLSGLPVTDDNPDDGQFTAATELDFGMTGRTVTAQGTIDQAGDSDIFVFDANTTDLATITVSRETGQIGMTPAVIIYELGQDNAPTPVPVNHVIAWDLNPDALGLISLDFSTQLGRRYYVVVRGSDPGLTQGDYNIEIDYSPEDDHADIGELLEASFINIVPSTGAGSETGILEQGNDSDLFVFGVPANGPVDISLVWNAEPGASFELQIFDVDGNVFDVDGDMMIDTYTSNSGFLAIPQFAATAGEIFYVAVLGPTASRIDYTINVNTGLVDDHANDAAFNLATVIPLDLETGDGSEMGRLEVDDDTDFFTFDVLDSGMVTIDLVTSTIATPVFRLYDSSMNLISFTQVDADTIEFDNVAGVNETYYVSIGSTFPGVRTGSYTINVDGPPVSPSPDDDHVNIGNLAGATFLAANATNGNARDTGVLDVVVDTDLFRYDTIGRGEIFVQVVSGDSPVPNFTVRIFDSAGTEITELADSDGVAGVAGVTAATNFNSIAAGQTFYILVDSTNDMSTGNYSIIVDGPAASTRTYYPEGFANAGIHEFVSLSNPNDESVSYSITVYYADASLGSAVVASGVLNPGARGGATLSFGADIDNDGNADFAQGIIANEAYAIVVESTLRIGASLSHYDNNLATNGAIGEAFSDVTSNRWDFPDVSRNPGVTEEFLVYYNPNSFDVNVTITAYTGSGSTVTLPVVTVGANRRGGLEIHNTSALPLGTFAIEITSAPVDSSNDTIDLGIIAGISRYNLVERFAFGYLGVRDGGSTTNIITSLTNGTDITSEFSIFNSTGTDATVTIVGNYLEDTSLPDLMRVVTVGAGERMRLTGNDLAFVTNESLGLEITSDVEVAISTIQRQRGDADATTAYTEAGESFYFGDAFMNPAHAGDLYTESLSFYNPNDSDTDVSITFYFADGSSERVRMETIASNDFLLLRLENLPEVITNRPLLNYFSMQIDATAGVVVQLTHYDGFLGGGWSSGGAPLGILGSIA